MNTHTIRVAFFLAISAVARASHADGSGLHHAAYVELGGSAIRLSANYELQPSHHLALRAGVGAGANLLVPVGASALVGAGEHQFEAGASVLLGRPSVLDGGNTVCSPLLGWRYTSDRSGLLLRATFVPMVQLGTGTIFPWAGVSGGMRF